MSRLERSYRDTYLVREYDAQDPNFGTLIPSFAKQPFTLPDGKMAYEPHTIIRIDDHSNQTHYWIAVHWTREDRGACFFAWYTEDGNQCSPRYGASDLDDVADQFFLELFIQGGDDATLL